MRRLQRAAARSGGRSRDAAAASRAPAASHSDTGGSGELDVAPGPTTDIQPRLGSASEPQIASVVGHPALVITRPIEW